MNLIDKDALIAKLEISEECSECKWVDGLCCKRYKTFVDACEAIFEAPVIEQPEWIPVTTDLPPEGKYVFCTTTTKKGLRQVVKGYYADGRWCCGMNSNVVAWKPLPDPWGGEADE